MGARWESKWGLARSFSDVLGTCTWIQMAESTCLTSHMTSHLWLAFSITDLTLCQGNCVSPSLHATWEECAPHAFPPFLSNVVRSIPKKIKWNRRSIDLWHYLRLSCSRRINCWQDKQGLSCAGWELLSAHLLAPLFHVQKEEKVSGGWRPWVALFWSNRACFLLALSRFLRFLHAMLGLGILYRKLTKV